MHILFAMWQYRTGNPEKCTNLTEYIEKTRRIMYNIAYIWGRKLYKGEIR